jgi:hypothetical protein
LNSSNSICARWGRSAFVWLWIARELRTVTRHAISKLNRVMVNWEGREEAYFDDS